MSYRFSERGVEAGFEKGRLFYMNYLEVFIKNSSSIIMSITKNDMVYVCRMLGYGVELPEKSKKEHPLYKG